MESRTSFIQCGQFIGEVIAVAEEMYLRIPETEAERRKRRSLIHNRFKLKNSNVIGETLNFLRDEGTRSMYTLLLPFILTAKDEQELIDRIRERFFAIEYMVQQAYNLYFFIELIAENEEIRLNEDDLWKGILVWDMARLVNNARMAHEEGHISEDKMEEYMEYAGEQCLSQFNNQEEMGKSYLLGQAMEVGNASKLSLIAGSFLQALQTKEIYK